MRIIITGNNGYIGTVLTPMLLELGHELQGLDTNLYESCTFHTDLPLEINTLNKDIRDVEIRNLEGFDAIIHLAGLSNDPLGYFNPKITYEINHHASVKLARLSKKAGIKRFLYASSCSNYGVAGDEFIDEEGDLNPITPYAISKMKVEEDLRKLADDHFSPVFLRNGTAYGFSPRIRFDLVVNNLVAWAYTTKQIYLKSDGSAWRPLVHIRDIAHAFIKILEAPLEIIHNQVFNIGNTSENYKVINLVEEIIKVIPDAEVKFAQGASADTRSYRVNCDKIQRLIPEYKPVWDVPKGIEELYESYKRINLHADDFESHRYKRVAHIKYLIDNGLLDHSLRKTFPQ
jgi:nucleoside-diphosphate-sugar epimerase